MGVLDNSVDKAVEDYQKENNIVFSKEQLLAFKLGYGAKQKEYENKDMEITKTIFKEMSQLKGITFYENCKSLAKELNVQCKVKLIGTSYAVFYNINKYRLIIKGKKINVEKFLENL